MFSCTCCCGGEEKSSGQSGRGPRSGQAAQDEEATGLPGKVRGRLAPVLGREGDHHSSTTAIFFLLLVFRQLGPNLARGPEFDTFALIQTKIKTPH